MQGGDVLHFDTPVEGARFMREFVVRVAGRGGVQPGWRQCVCVCVCGGGGGGIGVLGQPLPIREMHKRMRLHARPIREMHKRMRLPEAPVSTAKRGEASVRKPRRAASSPDESWDIV